ncbi:hypothetical protein QZH41_009449, partial [Actinostola sp. cb2023]
VEGKITIDDRGSVYGNGGSMGKDNNIYNRIQSYMFPIDIEVVAIFVENIGGPGGILASFSNGVQTDTHWKCTTRWYRNWHKTNYDDTAWPNAVLRGENGNTARGLPSTVRWMGVSDPNAAQFYCRRRLSLKPDPPSSPTSSCNEPLGLQNGWIENSAITASSNWDPQHMAWRARLHMKKQGSFIGGWTARVNHDSQWIQVDFGRSTRVTAVGTQGREDSDQWVTKYTLSYGNDPRHLIPYRVNGQTKEFSGNRDRNTIARNTVSPPIEGRYIRLHPKAWIKHISMRLEFYGCLMACKVDIGILMDESGSVNAEDWKREKDFVSDLTGHFKLGRDAAQFGVISFSTNAHLDIPLNGNSNSASFKRVVNNLKQARGWTYTARALNLAYTQLFSSAQGARHNVAKVLIVITDGKTTSGTNSLKAPVKRLKDSAVNIICIGVGNKVNKKELELMASEPSHSHVFYVSNMDQLKNLIRSITTSSCSSFTCRYVTCDYGAWSAWSKSCGQGMRRVRTLTKVNEHTIQQQGGCSGMKQTCDAQTVETKNDHCPCRYVSCSWNQWGAWSATCGKMTRQRTSKVTQQTVNRPNCNGLPTSCPRPETKSIYISCGWTFTDQALNLARTNLFQSGGGARPGVTKVLLILTDGASSSGYNSLIQPVKLLKEDHVNIFTIGVGRRINKKELEMMASDPVASHVFYVNKMEELPMLLQRISESSCQSKYLTVVRYRGMSVTSYLAAFTCKYVTCDYSTWTSWSASCGVGMRRTRKLVKVNQHTIEQQGGCSGLTTTCEESKTQTKDMDCPCRYVSCSWEAWSGWSATCGSAKRRRVSKARNHVVNRPSCSGLQTTCPAPETQKKTTN